MQPRFIAVDGEVEDGPRVPLVYHLAALPEIDEARQRAADEEVASWGRNG